MPSSGPGSWRAHSARNHHDFRLSSPHSESPSYDAGRRRSVSSVQPQMSVVINDIVGKGVSGILFKWVNYGRGWRRRWFVLQDGVLSYYKLHGRNKITVNEDTERGSKLIGEESLRRVYSQDIRHLQPWRKPCGEIHLKVSSIEESRTDDRRFSIFTGTKRLHLRAETREDRILWLEALQAVKELFPHVSNNELITPSENVVVSTEKLRQRLSMEGIPEPAIQDSEQIMKNEFNKMHSQLVVLKQRQVILVDALRHLETEKVDLENTLVDESQRRYKVQEASSTVRHNHDDGSASDTDVENDGNDAADEDTDDDVDEFFDTQDFLSSSSLKGKGSDFQGLSFDSDEREPLNSKDDIDSSIRSNGTNYPFVKRRKKLPDAVEKEKGVSLWSVIKDNIGKDLTKVCLPVYFNEPISSLQKCFEDLEYSFLLDQAHACGKMGNSLMRILNVAAFAVSGYACTDGRTCKPFNPLLGETYEANYPDMGLRFISEKVSHHPMVIACHCEGHGWKLWGDSTLKSKFWGRSIQLDPVGLLTLEFDDGEVFQYSKVTTSIYNLILGKPYCEHYGTMNIQGNREYSCKLKFKEQSIVDRNPHQVQGTVEDRKGKTVATLFGKWDESMHYMNGDCSGKGKKSGTSSDAQLLWQRSKPSKFQTRYNFSTFTMTLNELTPGLEEKLPPTDSRLRPDQRCLENGQHDTANSEKLRLEQRQRQATKMQERGWKPRWFAKEKGENSYRYIGGYWEAREAGKWESCPDIFGQVHKDHALDS